MKQVFLKILMVAAGILLGLALTEAGLRLAGIEYPLFYEYDPILGNALRPGVQGYYTNEGRVRFHFEGIQQPL